MGGWAPGAALVEAQGGGGEPGGSPVGELALGGRVGRERSSYAWSCALRLEAGAARRVGATPAGGVAWGLPLRVWAGALRVCRVMANHVFLDDG